MTDVTTFTDITLANLTRSEAEFVCGNTPAGSRAHVSKSMRGVDLFMVLVEDLPISAGRDLLTGLAQFRVTAGLTFPDVPDWRDIRTGTTAAWPPCAASISAVHPPASALSTSAPAASSAAQASSSGTPWWHIPARPG
jgi:hypothetical protein